MCSTVQIDETELQYKFTAYLELAIKHAKIDFLRVYIRRRKREAVLHVLPETAIIEQDVSAHFSIKGFDNEALDRAFDSLPLKMQNVLTCAFLYQMSAGEIATIYGYKKNQVYKLKHKALQQLRTAMASDHEGGDLLGS